MSLKDVFLTAPSGVPLGELAYRSVVEVGSKLFPDEALPEDARGRYVSNAIALVAGAPLEMPGASATLLRVDARGSFVWLPGYRASGSFERVFWHAEHLTCRASGGASAEGALFDGDATTLLVGYAAQAFDEGATSRRALVVGGPLGFRYRAASVLGVRELLAVTRFLGIGFEARVEGTGRSLAVSGEVAGHMSGASAPTVSEWRALEPGHLGKSVSRRKGYFYGLGHAAELRASGSCGILGVEASVGLFAALSIDGLDRAQESLTVDEAISLRRLEASGRVALALPGDRVSVFAGTELVRWRSRVQDEGDDVRVVTTTAGMAFAL